jgi:hypothetical protein
VACRGLYSILELNKKRGECLISLTSTFFNRRGRGTEATGIKSSIILAVKNRKTVYNGKLDIRWQIQVITISRTSKGIIAHKKKKKPLLKQ